MFQFSLRSEVNFISQMRIVCAQLRRAIAHVSELSGAAGTQNLKGISLMEAELESATALGVRRIRNRCRLADRGAS